MGPARRAGKRRLPAAGGPAAAAALVLQAAAAACHEYLLRAVHGHLEARERRGLVLACNGRQAGGQPVTQAKPRPPTASSTHKLAVSCHSPAAPGVTTPAMAPAGRTPAGPAAGRRLSSCCGRPPAAGRAAAGAAAERRRGQLQQGAEPLTLVLGAWLAELASRQASIRGVDRGRGVQGAVKLHAHSLQRLCLVRGRDERAECTRAAARITKYPACWAELSRRRGGRWPR